MPAITRSRRSRNVRARAATVGTAALVMTALEACGSDDDSTDAASAPSFTSGSAASPEAAAGNDTDDEAVDAAGNAGDGRDVASIGTCVGGENITVNMDDAQPIITGDCGTVIVNVNGVGGAVDNAAEIIINGESVTLTGKDWGVLTVNGDESRVQNFGLDSLAITGDNNTVVGGPAGGAPVSDTGTGNTVI